MKRIARIITLTTTLIDSLIITIVFALLAAATLRADDSEILDYVDTQVADVARTCASNSVEIADVARTCASNSVEIADVARMCASNSVEIADVAATNAQQTAAISSFSSALDRKLDKSGGTMTGVLHIPYGLLSVEGVEGSAQWVVVWQSALDNWAFRIKPENSATPYYIIIPNTGGTLALTSDIPDVPAWALEAQKPTYTASDVGAYSTNTIDAILQDYLPLDYFQAGQTIPMYWGDGTKLCDFGANWLGSLVNTVSEKPDAADIPPAVSNTVTTTYVRNRLGVWMEYDETTGLYYHCHEEE